MRLAIWTSPAGLYSRLSTRLKGTIPNPDDIKESYRAKQRLLREEKANSAETKNGWKPLSMTAPVLGSVVLLTLLIAATVEVLAQRTRDKGGLAISPTLDDIPKYAMWSYLYGPNVVAVLYSMIWTWIDLDARRMQPWFELSKETGSQPEDSLLLEYPYDFVAVVPWKSAQKRHWPVFLASSAMMLVFWAITPLQSAILATDTIQYRGYADITHRSQLASVTSQAQRLNTDLRGNLYFTTWLKLDYPPFTTPEYALLPFQGSNRTSLPASKGNISAATTKIWTEIDCSPSEVDIGPNTSPSGVLWDKSTPVTLSHTNGCNSTVFPSLRMWETESAYNMDYWGSYLDARDDDDLKGNIKLKSGSKRWELASPECQNVEKQFAATWMTQTLDDDSIYPKLNATAIHCDIHYYKQLVWATVDAKTFRPVDKGITELSARQELGSSEFNHTAFERFIRFGKLKGDLVDTRESPSYTHDPWLLNTGLENLIKSTAIPDAVGYALAVDMLDLARYADRDTMAQAYKTAWKRQFALAISNLVVDATDSKPSQARIEGPMAAIVVNRAFATTVEVLLGVVAFLTCLLSWTCRIAPCHLRSNPSSISRLAAMVRNSPDIQESFTGTDALDVRRLGQALRNSRFQLVQGEGQSEPKIVLTRSSKEQAAPATDRRDNKLFRAIKPVALRKWTGGAFLIVLAGVLAALGVLKAMDSAQNGLSRPSSNPEVLQILENYIPTAFATVVEPFWVMLNRLLCVLQPFTDLSRGKARASETIRATYTAVPPQLAILRALKSNHFILALVCFMAFLANLLALGMGALFNEQPLAVEVSYRFKPAASSEIDKSALDLYLDQKRSYFEEGRHTYELSVQANITHGLNLPPWTTEDLYFQQVSFEGAPKTDAYTVKTRGYSIDPNCTYTPPHSIPLKFTADEGLDNHAGSDKGNKTFFGSDCVPHSLKAAEEYMRSTMDSGNTPSKRSKFEYMSVWPYLFRRKVKIACNPTLMIAWGRTNNTQMKNSTIEASTMVCTPMIQTAMYNVTVDPRGKVLSSKRVSPVNQELPGRYSSQNARMLIAMMQQDISYDSNEWSEDTEPHSTFRWLLSMKMKSKALDDPVESLPKSGKEVISHVEGIIRQLFVSLVAFNTDIFAEAGEDEWIDGTIHVEETKIFMNDTAFIITITVLVLDMLVAVLFYATIGKLALPRMPTTNGSILGYIASSRFVHDEKEDDMDTSDTYSFGRFLGHDGKTRVGIEIDPFVMPIGPESLQERRSMLERLGLHRRRSRYQQ